jgi:hypothetical protein
VFKLSKYIVNKPLELSRSLESRVVLPLTLITIFCFSYVLMQTPVKPQKQHASTGQTNNLASSNGQSPLPVTAPPPVDKLETISLPMSSGLSTASPQSGQTSQTLQSANNGNSNGKGSLKVDIVKQLNSLLNN